MTQPAAGGGAAAREFMRCGTVEMFCTQHPDDPTLWCMDQFLQLHCFCPGIFLAANHDTAGSAYRMVKLRGYPTYGRYEDTHGP